MEPYNGSFPSPLKPMSSPCGGFRFVLDDMENFVPMMKEDTFASPSPPPRGVSRRQQQPPSSPLDKKLAKLQIDLDFTKGFLRSSEETIQKMETAAQANLEEQVKQSATILSLKKQTLNQETTIQDLRSDGAALQSAVAEFEAERLTLKASLKDLKSEKAEVEKEVTRLTTAVEEAVRGQKRLQTRLAEESLLESELDTMRRLNSDLTDKLDVAQKLAEELEQRVRVLMSDLEEVQKAHQPELEELKERVRELESTGVQSLADELEAADRKARLAAAEESVTEYQEQVCNLTADLVQRDCVILRLQEMKEKHDTELADLQQQLKQSSLDCLSYTVTIESLRDQITHLALSISQLQSELLVRDETITALTSRITVKTADHTSTLEVRDRQIETLLGQVASLEKTAQHREEECALTATFHHREVEAMEKRHADALHSVETDHLRQVALLEKDHLRQVGLLEKDHLHQVALLEKEHAQALSDVRVDVEAQALVREDKLMRALERERELQVALKVALKEKRQAQEEVEALQRELQLVGSHPAVAESLPSSTLTRFRESQSEFGSRSLDSAMSETSMTPSVGNLSTFSKQHRLHVATNDEAVTMETRTIPSTSAFQSAVRQRAGRKLQHPIVPERERPLAAYAGTPSSGGMLEEDYRKRQRELDSRNQMWAPHMRSDNPTEAQWHIKKRRSSSVDNGRPPTPPSATRKRTTMQRMASVFKLPSEPCNEKISMTVSKLQLGASTSQLNIEPTSSPVPEPSAKHRLSHRPAAESFLIVNTPKRLKLLRK